MADEPTVTFVEEGIHLAQGVGVIDHEHQFSLKSGVLGRTNNHVSGENFSYVADVKLSTWSNSCSNDVSWASAPQSFCHHVSPMHEFTSHGHGSNQAS